MGTCLTCFRPGTVLEDGGPQEAAEEATRGRVPVFIMMPLDWMTDDGMALRSPEKLSMQLKALRDIGVRGVMADVWWGLCEEEAGKYRFGAAQAICALLKENGLQLQATMSFHQCGGNVGDVCSVPLPPWVLSTAREKDLLYRYSSSHVSQDYLSLAADDLRVLAGPAGLRTPLECYRDFMAAFLAACKEFIGSTVCELQVGMGPCGELRYPSYMMAKGWQYPGVGLVTADDEHMRNKLKADVGVNALPAGLPSDQNALPDASPIFKAGPPTEEAFRQGDGKIFFEWYTKVLIDHGRAVLAAATDAMAKQDTQPAPEDLYFSVKVSGLHWHVMHPSRATEACAGYNNCTHDKADAYSDIAAMLSAAATHAGRPVNFCFTCLEMTNTDNNGNPQTLSAPEDLIAQVRRACIIHDVPLAGENALEFNLSDGDWQFNQMSKQMRGWSPGRDRMHALTLLRLNDSYTRNDVLAGLQKFIART